MRAEWEGEEKGNKGSYIFLRIIFFPKTRKHLHVEVLSATLLLPYFCLNVLIYYRNNKKIKVTSIAFYL